MCVAYGGLDESQRLGPSVAADLEADDGQAAIHELRRACAVSRGTRVAGGLVAKPKSKSKEGARRADLRG